MVWRAKADSYSSFMGAAVLAGIGTGPGEVRKPENSPCGKGHLNSITSQTIPPAIIADVMFLHERGFYNTLYFATFYAAVMVRNLLPLIGLR